MRHCWPQDNEFSVARERVSGCRDLVVTDQVDQVARDYRPKIGAC